MVQETARCTGEINSTAQTRMSRTCRSRLICTASRSTCATMTPASNVSDLCREGIAIMGENYQPSEFCRRSCGPCSQSLLAGGSNGHRVKSLRGNLDFGCYCRPPSGGHCRLEHM